MIVNKNKGAASPAAVAKTKGAVERTSREAAEQARKPLQTEAVPAKVAASAKPAAKAPAKPAVKPETKSETKAAAKPKASAKPAVAETTKASPAAKAAPEAKTAGAPKPETETGAVAKTEAPEAKAPEKAAEAKPARKPAVKPEEAAKKPLNQRQGFKTQEFIVYPAHGVGQIMAIEEQEVAGYKLELFVISFAKDKMTLRVPITKVATVGMRKLAEPAIVKRALDTLKGRARIKRTMWSRRAQEYEAKINSGDIVAIAEVVRDLYRSDTQPEQSYSERQLYEAALDRLAREIAAVERVTETEAVKQIEGALAKGPRRGAKTAEAAEASEGEDDGEGDGFVADEAA